MKKILIFFFTIALMGNYFATHNRAGEILYKRVAPFTSTVGGVVSNVYTYSITVIIYTDDGSQVADRCNDTLYFGDGTKAVIARMNGSGTNSCTCYPTCGDIIVNSPTYKVKKNIYSVIHTYPGQGSYLIYTFDRNRNQGISNVPNSINSPFYIESNIIIDPIITANSSPVLNNPPIDIASNVNCFYHQPNATDADGDSLSYQLIACKGQNGQSISGYTYPNFSPNGYFFMSTNGLISWCNPASIGEYNIAFYVKEWRKNSSGVYQMIGLVERDMQVIVNAQILGLNTQSSIQNNFDLYPNPFVDQLIVELKSQANESTIVKLYSIDGKLMLEGQLTNKQFVFATNQLAKGMYYIALQQNQSVQYKRVIKN